MEPKPGAHRGLKWLLLSILLVAGGWILIHRIVPYVRFMPIFRADPVPAIMADQKKLAALEVPVWKTRVAICPFTDADGQFTTDTLAIYVPTLYQSIWASGRMLDTVDEALTLQTAASKRLLFPGEPLAELQKGMFAQALGCTSFFTAQIYNKGADTVARLEYHPEIARDSAGESADALEVELISVPSGQETLLPGKIALAILRKVVPHKVNKAVEASCARPAASSMQSMREAFALEKSFFCDPEWEEVGRSARALLEREPDMDYIRPLYYSCQGEMDLKACVDELKVWTEQHPDNVRVQAVYAAQLMASDKAVEALHLLMPLLEKDPGNWRARWVAVRCVRAKSGIKDAYPLYEDLLKMAPDNAWALAILGEADIELAWEWRGSGWARTVTSEGWNKFYEYLKVAETHLGRCVELSPSHAPAYAGLIRAGMGLGRKYPEIHAIFVRGAHANPDGIETYRAMQQFLMPRWSGSLKEEREFWAEFDSFPIRNPNIFLLPVDYHYTEAGTAKNTKTVQQERNRAFNDYLAQPDVWQDIDTAYRKYFAAGGNRPQAHANYGYYACVAKQRELSFQQFELCGTQIENKQPFYYINYIRMYAIAAGHSKHYQRAIEISEFGLKLNHCADCNQFFTEMRDECRKLLDEKK